MYLYLFNYLAGVLDLKITNQVLDPDDGQLTLVVAGAAYGSLTYSGDTDLLSLGVPSPTGGVRMTSAVKSCSVPAGSNGCCGDLFVEVGMQQESYSSGDGLGNRRFAVDLDSTGGLSSYPFDK
jgi:hypothetical protein